MHVSGQWSLSLEASRASGADTLSLGGCPGGFPHHPELPAWDRTSGLGPMSRGPSLGKRHSPVPARPPLPPIGPCRTTWSGAWCWTASAA